MTFAGDIKLDADGNTVIDNGVIDVSTSNLEFVLRELRWGPGSWQYDASLGFGMDRYLGRVANNELIEVMTAEITDHFKQFGILVVVDLLITGDNEIGGNINIPLEDESTSFIFNLGSGEFDINNDIETEDIEEDTGIQTQDPVNPYLQRR